MKIKILTKIEQINIEDIISMYIKNGWGDGYEPEYIENIFKNSTYNVFAIDNDSNTLMGFVRVLSDNYQTTWISEILVSPDYQKLGIGTMLLTEIKKEFSHTAIYAETFSGKEVFFEKNDIKSKKNMVVVCRSKDL